MNMNGEMSYEENIKVDSVKLSFKIDDEYADLTCSLYQLMKLSQKAQKLEKLAIQEIQLIF